MTYQELQAAWENARREVERLLYSTDRAAVEAARSVERKAWDALMHAEPTARKETP